MNTKKLSELNERYELELNKVIEKIQNNKSKKVLLQFPDGLKQYSTEITDYLCSKTKNVKFFIWLGTCFGACDTPVLGKETEKKIDLVVQFGHNELMPSYIS